MSKLGDKIHTKEILMVSDFDDTYTPDELAAEKNYLEKLTAQLAQYNVKLTVEEVETENDLREILKKYNKNEVVVFNWCEKLGNKEGTENKVARVYEDLGFRFTGASSKILELTADKYEIATILGNHNVLTPNSYLIKKKDPVFNTVTFDGKMIAKSNSLHASAGLHKDNVVENKEQLENIAKRMFSEVDTDVIAQQFIDGEEFTCVVWGNESPSALPIIKLIYKDSNVSGVYTKDSKFNSASEEYKNCIYELVTKSNGNDLYTQLQETAIKAYQALGMRDYARIDLRCKNSDIYVIDVNANPYINVLSENESCEVFRCSEALGYNWGETILQICEFAYKRTLTEKKINNENYQTGQVKNGLKLPEYVNKIAIVYSHVKREYFPTEEQYITEKDAGKDAEFIAEEIRRFGVDCRTIPADDSLVESLKEYKPDMVFNLVDSVKGLEYLASTIPGILDMLDIPFTGATLLGLALCYNKFLSKKLLQSAGIPVPNFQLFHTPNDKLDIDLRFPLISKLNEIHGGVEINESAISEDEKQLRERLTYLMKTYGQEVVVEEYIAGREAVAIVLQGSNIKIYMGEKIFNKPDQKYIITTFEDQWVIPAAVKEEDDIYRYVKYEDSLLKEYVRRAFYITNMLDYGKFDIRIDASGRYYFIDSNANPAFGPKALSTAMGYITQGLYNVPFNVILRRIICNTVDASEAIQNGDDITSSERD